MITPVGLQPVIPRNSTFQRNRHPAAQLPELHKDAHPNPDLPNSGDEAPVPDAAPSEPEQHSSPTFTTALIANAYPAGSPHSEDIIRRLGTAPTPPESEARLKDLLA